MVNSEGDGQMKVFIITFKTVAGAKKYFEKKKQRIRSSLERRQGNPRGFPI